MLLVWGPHFERQLILGQPLPTNRKTDGEEIWIGKQPLIKGVAGLILMSQHLQASVSYL